LGEQLGELGIDGLFIGRARCLIALLHQVLDLLLQDLCLRLGLLAFTDQVLVVRMMLLQALSGATELAGGRR
jgi:hypothetical protein